MGLEENIDKNLIKEDKEENLSERYDKLRKEQSERFYEGRIERKFMHCIMLAYPFMIKKC